MDESIFQSIGFTKAETKVYLALLKIGVTTAGSLLKETSLQNSTLHKTLNRLVKDGFASFIIKGKIRHYRASDPEILLKSLKDKENKLTSIMPFLKDIQKPLEKQEAEIYEGIKGLKNMLYEFVKEAKKGDEYLFFAFYTDNPDNFDDIYNFYADFEKERKKLGLVLKGIAPLSIKSKFEGRDIKNVRFVDFPVPLNISVLNNKIIFTPWQDKEVSFLIYSKQLAESFRKYFYSIYK